MKLSNTHKKIITTVATCIILTVMYYGSYLPFRKSAAFIGNQGAIRSLEDFKKVFSSVLDIPSPIGQEELVRNTASNVLNVAQGTDDKAVIGDLVKYVEDYYRPIIEYGRGMSFGQDLYVLGTLNEVAFLKTQEQSYLNAAGNYYSKGLALAPKRPQFLYGMLDLYRFIGDKEGVARIGNQIMEQWPDDARVKDLIK